MSEPAFSTALVAPVDSGPETSGLISELPFEGSGVHLRPSLVEEDFFARTSSLDVAGDEDTWSISTEGDALRLFWMKTTAVIAVSGLIFLAMFLGYQKGLMPQPLDVGQAIAVLPPPAR